ncbi:MULTISPECIES: putative quinol monooxygenase [unclassified Brenneria]|uniref:putative quinol monooxygenase n=1 Tax=unclassified Brenneria TaxID=2634434 RepID=UPI0015552455|nr:MULTISPECIES: putative quinol monooxygenase [unclassified Brenneria]MBJ7221129.1 antibiotic biosynthesis monooxygenase [Brenneria sp. L3-3C-1]MEE3642370.1 putative quinol monooxygenase [Brenneria sp. L3_3C_1]MEE3650259.1 putative quinol monooxygenase [Brenneria sp. HEZEL_4_2_4]NPD00215.1 antibiotic biosynthesis monooxygenase [Brenneria sp. hezel4-2-4]
MEIRIVASVQAKAEFIAEVTAALRQVVAPSRQEPGNLQYDLHQEIDKPEAFVFFERWKSQTALTEHEQTEHFQRLVSQLEGKTEQMDIKLLKYLD